jgi:nucleoside-diphosphate-sugar epimerase
MRVFVTGASGWVGSALVPELIDAGHQVVGLARSDDAADGIAAAGADVLRGSLDDLDSLREGAATSDGVIHLAFIHDFSQFEAANQADREAIATMGAALAGTERPFVIASGVATTAAGRASTEEDPPTPDFPRSRAADMALALRDAGVRPAIVRLPPTTHGDGDKGFIPTIIGVARERGVSGFVGDGSNVWPAVHRYDAARVFRLALGRGESGAVYHAVGEEGVSTRAIAEVIGRHLDVPVASIDQANSMEHFGWIGMIWAGDLPASNAITRERLGWEPTGPTLIEDLETGRYFESAG